MRLDGDLVTYELFYSSGAAQATHAGYMAELERRVAHVEKALGADIETALVCFFFVFSFNNTHYI